MSVSKGVVVSYKLKVPLPAADGRREGGLREREGESPALLSLKKREKIFFDSQVGSLLPLFVYKSSLERRIRKINNKADRSL